MRDRQRTTPIPARHALALSALVLAGATAGAQEVPAAAREYPLSSAAGLPLHDVTAKPVTHAGKRGAIALWIDVGTVAHFRDVRVTPW